MLLNLLAQAKSQDLPTAPNKKDADGKKHGRWQYWLDSNEVATTADSAAYKQIITFELGTVADTALIYNLDGSLFAKAEMKADSLGEPIRHGYIFYYDSTEVIKNLDYYTKGETYYDSFDFYYGKGEYDSAAFYAELAKLYTCDSAFCPTCPACASSLNNLAVLYYTQGLYGQAEAPFLQSGEIWKNALGETHPDYALSLNNLAFLYHAQGLYGQAEAPFLQSGEIWKNALGETHPYYATSLHNLAGLYEAQGL